MLNRVQKLLQSEYSDFNDTILIESPFAQVTRNGIGIKQVQIGLTSTKIIIATDVFHENSSNFSYKKNIDPETECLELITIVPLDLIKLKVYRRNERQLLKITYCTQRIMYFEFSGFILRNLYWNIWRDKILMMNGSTESTNSSVRSGNTSFRKIEVKADVHRNNSNKEGSDLSLWNDIRDNLSWRRNNEEKFNDRKEIMREVASFFLGTQSKMLSYDDLDGREKCREFVMKSFPSRSSGDSTDEQIIKAFNLNLK